MGYGEERIALMLASTIKRGYEALDLGMDQHPH